MSRIIFCKNLLSKYYQMNLNYTKSIELLTISTWKYDHENNKKNNHRIKFAIGTSIVTFAILSYFHKRNMVQAKEDLKNFGKEIKGLKVYTSEEVAKHNDKNKRIWVSFEQGVYDITDFVGQHPGGDKILMAAGGALEPFWELYSIHKQENVLKILEQHRIGNLDAKDRVKEADKNDPYSNDPIRHPVLTPRSVKPFNAEPPMNLLLENFITPNEVFFVRNHLPVPEIDPKTYTLEIEGFGLKNSRELTLDDIKKFPKHTVTCTIQCAGNRRSELNNIKQVKGLSWGAAAISNAQWSGAKLVDVLKHFGLDFKDQRIKHVQFEGYDFDPASMPYGGSVMADVALDPRAEFILAYEMNGKEIPRDHGFPIRLIAPGIVGARNVKWLKRIVLSDEESESFWQRRDYKSFSPNVDWDNVNFDEAPSIQELPVQSAICDPSDGESVTIDKNGQINIRGYAYGGGGKKIIRVDVSIDHGKSWFTAQLQQEQTPLNRTWSWTLWKAQIPVSKSVKKGDTIEIICKATDSSYNTQPETFGPIWNLRGVLGNAWHRIHVKVTSNN